MSRRNESVEDKIGKNEIESSLQSSLDHYDRTVVQVLKLSPLEF